MRALIKFLGGVADNNLTGSCSLLQMQMGKKSLNILIDAGLVQGRFHDSIEKNLDILNSIKPSDINFIILTHSHIDHIGRLPLLAKSGFNGRIICTTGTKNLLQTMLEDSAKIQMAEAGYLLARARKENSSGKQRKNNHQRPTRGKYDRMKRKEKKSSAPRYQALYTIDDVNLVGELIKNGGYNYHQWIKLSHNVSLKFYPSGHVMGGAIVVVKIDDRIRPRTICFSGDLGRRDGIILPPPGQVQENVDCLILESTYGGRYHPERDEEIVKLLKLANRAQREEKRIIIPSFTLERAQEIIYLLSYHMEKNDIPPLPIYLDSPLGAKVTAAFAAGWENGMFSDQERLGFNPFDPNQNKHLHIATTPEESNKLITKEGGHVIIAGSGMCDAGRVRGHLRDNLSKKNTIVFLVGYMAENTLGRRLKDGHHIIRMNKEEIVVRAEIISFDSFSAHADSLFLAQYAASVLKSKNNSKQIYLVHGSTLSANDLREDLREILPNNSQTHIGISIPKLNEKVYIN